MCSSVHIFFFLRLTSVALSPSSFKPLDEQRLTGFDGLLFVSTRTLTFLRNYRSAPAANPVKGTAVTGDPACAPLCRSQWHSRSSPKFRRKISNGGPLRGVHVRLGQALWGWKTRISERGLDRGPRRGETGHVAGEERSVRFGNS
jgi:hypothetical protein